MENNMRFLIPNNCFNNLLENQYEGTKTEFSIQRINEIAESISAVVSSSCNSRHCEIILVTNPNEQPSVVLEIECANDLVNVAEDVEIILQNSMIQRIKLATKLSAIFENGNHQGLLKFRKNLPDGCSYEHVEKTRVALSRLPNDTVCLVNRHGAEVSLNSLNRVSPIIQIEVDRELTVGIDNISYKSSRLSFSTGTTNYLLTCAPEDMDTIRQLHGKSERLILKFTELSHLRNNVNGVLVAVEIP